MALNAKVMAGSLGDNDKMVAVASGTEIILWAICPDGNGNEIGATLPTVMILHRSWAGVETLTALALLPETQRGTKPDTSRVSL